VNSVVNRRINPCKVPREVLLMTTARNEPAVLAASWRLAFQFTLSSPHCRNKGDFRSWPNGPSPPLAMISDILASAVW
jgi:hypothetical protein